MDMLIGSLSGHRKACRYKQVERNVRIAELPTVYHEELTAADTLILQTPLDELVADIHKGERMPIEILHAYGKKALRVHAETNCLTEIMIADAETWAEEAQNSKGPLAGIPGIGDCVSQAKTSLAQGYRQRKRI
jgi:hypothetical protein